MKTSSGRFGRFKILAAVVVPLLSWWFSWHYYRASKQTEAERSDFLVQPSSLPTLQESKQAEASELEPAMALRAKDTLEKARASSVEFSSGLTKRTSWNGQTDPDSLWYGQRQEANRTLMENGLRTLDGKGRFPDTVTPSRPIFR